MRGRRAAFCAVLVLLACAGITAQQADTKPTPAPQPKAAAKTDSGTEEAYGRADFTRTVWGQKRTVLMKGNVKFTHGDTVLTSDQVTYDQESKVAVSPGKVAIADPECDITGDNGTAYFKKKLGVLEGHVVMLAKPKKSEKEAQAAAKPNDEATSESVRGKLKEPTTITCPKLEYQYKDKIATATGGVFFKQAKRSASAEKVVYDTKKELVTLSGNVKGTDEYGQTFSAPGTVVISIKEGDEWMEAWDASSRFKIETEEKK